MNLRTRQPARPSPTPWHHNQLQPPMHTSCPACKTDRMFATQLSHDPHGWADETNKRMATAWLRTHPCRKPTTT